MDQRLRNFEDRSQQFWSSVLPGHLDLPTVGGDVLTLPILERSLTRGMVRQAGGDICRRDDQSPTHHESANQTRGKRLDIRGSCPTFMGLTTPLPSSPGLYHGPTWQLETEDWSSKAILSQNRGSLPATNEPWTGVCEATRSGPIGLAETRGNG